MMTIYDKTGTAILTTEVADTSVRKRALMGDNYVQLDFRTVTYVAIPIGAYVEYGGERFRLIREQKPDTADGGWSYSVQFEGVDCLLKQYVMKFRTSAADTTFDMVFALTSDLRTFIDLVVRDINAEQSDTVFETGDIDSSLVDTITVSFQGETLFDALTAIAEAFDTEWFTTYNGTTVRINACRCETGGSYIQFKEGGLLRSMTRQEGDDAEYGTRFYVLGGTKNLTAEYDEGRSTGLNNVYAERRLRLPDGQDYIDSSNIATAGVVQKLVMFDDIYPTSTETVTSVEVVTTVTDGVTKYMYTMYCADTSFAGKADIAEGCKLGCKFLTGSLAGMEFTLTIVETGTYDKKFTVEPNNLGTTDNPVWMPNSVLHPAAADTFVLTGIILPAAKIAAAESSLLAAGTAWAEKHSKDTDVYECEPDKVAFANLGYDFELGQKVCLVDTQRFGSSGRNSRVQSYEKRLWASYDAKYEVGDNAKYSRLASIEGSISSTEVTQRFGSASSTSLSVIKTGDETAPSDYNVYSGLLSKTENEKRVAIDDLLIASDTKDALDTNVYSAYRSQTEDNLRLKIADLIVNASSATPTDTTAYSALRSRTEDNRRLLISNIISNSAGTTATNANVYSALKSKKQDELRFLISNIVTSGYSTTSDSTVYSSLKSYNEDEKRISAVAADTAAGLISFTAGINVGSSSQAAISAAGYGTLNGLTNNGATVGSDFHNSSFASGTAGSGFRIYMNGSTSYAEVDNLLVRKSAHFVELIIDRLRAVGGRVIVSPASATIKSVTTNSTYYRCYLQVDDGSKALTNEFAVGDLAMCQTFNIRSGVYSNVSNRYYWRKVVAVGTDYVDLSASDCDTSSVAPAADDVICTVGNATDTTRQSAILLSAYGTGAPSLVQYGGITSYVLSGRELQIISPSGNKFTGTFYFANGKAVSDWTTRIDTWADDGYVSPAEKETLKQEIVAIDADREAVLARVTQCNKELPTAQQIDSSAYEAAYTNYLTELTYYTAAAPESIEIVAAHDIAGKRTTYYTALKALNDQLPSVEVTVTDAKLAVKAAKTYTDAGGNTVDTVAQVKLTAEGLTSLTARVTTAEGTITTQGTAITQNADAILLKASQTDLDTTNGNVAANTSAIAVNANAITLKAASTYTDADGNTVDTVAQVKVNSENISLKVNTSDMKSTLLATGIDIDAKTVTVTASSFKVQDTWGTGIAVFTMKNGQPTLSTGVIDADYINALSLTTTKGTIGGWTITADAITSASSKSVLSADGDLSLGNGRFEYDATLDTLELNNMKLLSTNGWATIDFSAHTFFVGDVHIGVLGSSLYVAGSSNVIHACNTANGAALYAHSANVGDTSTGGYAIHAEGNTRFDTRSAAESNQFNGDVLMYGGDYGMMRLSSQTVNAGATISGITHNLVYVTLSAKTKINTIDTKFAKIKGHFIILVNPSTTYEIVFGTSGNIQAQGSNYTLTKGAHVMLIWSGSKWILPMDYGQ